MTQSLIYRRRPYRPDDRTLPSRLAAIAAGAFALTLYALTLAPDVGPVDSGELTLAAWELGVPHPPGFPLYVLLTHFIALAPVGSIAVRVNFASALFAAIATAGMFHLTWLAQHVETAAARQTPRAKTQARPNRAEWVQLCGAMTAACLFMSIRTMWAYATVAEVYALTACLTIGIWQLMLRPSLQRIRIAALIFGLALGTHTVIVVSMLPALALLVFRTHGVRFLVTRQFVMLFTLAALGAGIYLYLPWAALRSPILNWGNPVTAEEWWAHVSGLQYRGEALDISAASVLAALERSGAIMRQQFGTRYPPFALLLVIVGAVHTFRHRRTIFGVLATWIATNVVLTTLMNAGWAGDRALELIASVDLDAYYIPTFIATCIWAGFGAATLLSTAVDRARPTIALVVSAVCIATACLQPLTGNWRTSNRTTDVVSRQYVDDALESIGPGGMLLVRDWNLSSPMMYVQHVEHARRDVVVIDLNLMEREWYADSLARRNPAVFAAAHEEYAAFKNLGQRWRQDPRSIQRDASYLAALNDALERLLLRALDAHLQRAPVYVTFEVMVGKDGKQDSLAATLASRFQLIPQGLAFELVRDSRFRQPGPLKLNISPLRDIEHRVGPDPLVSAQIATMYRDMLISRGIYLERNGRCPEAVAAFTHALSIDSTSPMARTVKGRCHGSAGSIIYR